LIKRKDYTKHKILKSSRIFLRFLSKQTVEMLGSGLRFGALRGEDRFYVPVKARKNQNQQKQARRSKKGDETDSLDSARKSKDPSNSLAKPSLEQSVKPVKNLDRFLESTTPLVPAQYFSKVDLLSSLCACLVVDFLWFLRQCRRKY
jgi:hypothetical protein